MTKVLFDTRTSREICNAQCNKPNMVKEAFINSNTFSGCLNSTGVVQRFHLDPQGNMHLSQPLK